jgi:ornithine cyclodeaminase
VYYTICVHEVGSHEFLDGAELSVDRRLPYLTVSELSAVLPMRAAVDALQRALASERDEPREVPARVVLPVTGQDPEGDGEMLLMPALGPEGVGTKLVTVTRSNPSRSLPMIQGLYVLFSPVTLTPELLIEGGALTRLRTAAVSALATRYLAREDSRQLVVFGAGVQASGHIEAMTTVRPIESTAIVASSPASERGRELVCELRNKGLDANLARPDAVGLADIVCTCTTSTTPVFDGRAVRAGTHVNAIGAYRPDMRELDDELLQRALLVVESRAAALAEAGDIIQAIATRSLPERDFAHELSEVVNGAAGRGDDEQITVFKSVGLASEDLILARAAADRLRDAARPSLRPPS